VHRFCAHLAVRCAAERAHVAALAAQVQTSFVTKSPSHARLLDFLQVRRAACSFECFEGAARPTTPVTTTTAPCDGASGSLAGRRIRNNRSLYSIFEVVAQLPGGQIR